MNGRFTDTLPNVYDQERDNQFSTSRRRFLVLTAALVGSLIGKSKPSPAQAEQKYNTIPLPDDELFLTPVEQEGLLVYGAESPITQGQFKQLMDHLNAEFDMGKTSVEPQTYYSTDIVSPQLLADIEQKIGGGYSYLDFVKMNYAFMNQSFAEASLPHTLVLRRVIIIGDDVKTPSGMSREWMQDGPKDSHGGGGDSLLKQYVTWDGFWGPSKEESMLPVHETWHLFGSPDTYWHDFPYDTNDSALIGVSSAWARYWISSRWSDRRSGIMDLSSPRLGIEMELMFARRELGGSATLPVPPEYYSDISGFPNRFAEEYVMKICNDKAAALAGSKVTVYRKNPDAARSHRLNPTDAEYLESKKNSRGASSISNPRLDLLDLVDIITDEEGGFALPNVFQDLVYGNGKEERIRTPYDTLFIRFEDNLGNLLAAMWMDSIDFSTPTGVEPTFPKKIELTINPVLVSEMDSLHPRDHNWSIGCRPLDEFVPGNYTDPELQRLVDSYSTTLGNKPTSTPTAEPTETPTPKPTSTPTAEPTETPTPKPTSTPTAMLDRFLAYLPQIFR
jgi:hypothetical protein